MRALALTLVLLAAACGERKGPPHEGEPPDTDDEEIPPVACPLDRLVAGRLTGDATTRPNVVVAVLDASSWRFDDAADLSDLGAPDPATGAFTLCLDASVTVPAVYVKAFVAAWQDLDGDQRYDASAEDLCDASAAGETTYLYYGTTGAGTGWSVGVERAGFGALSETYSPILDGDACRR